jgi:hypothetical protein
MPRKEHKPHHLIYYDTTKKEYVATTPKDWARKNKFEFPPKFTFTNGKTTPTVDEIERHLKYKYKFVEFTYDEVIVLCNFDTKINFTK